MSDAEREYPERVRVVSVAEGGVAHGIVLPGDVLLAIGGPPSGPHATHEIATDAFQRRRRAWCQDERCAAAAAMRW